MTTYMEIVNKVIKRTNEVQTDATNFASVIGVQAAIKDSVIDSLDKIYQKKYKWPFLATEHTQVLTPGVQTYDWEEDFLSADWTSFYIQKSQPLNVSTHNLEFIEREEWYRYYRSTDLNYDSPEGNMPRFVFSGHMDGYGVSPRPDRAYTLRYNYFRNPERPVLFDDVIDLPTEYEYLLIQGGLMHMYLFYDNNERSAIAEKRFDDGLKDMTQVLIGNNLDHVYAGVVNRVNW